MPMVYFLGGQAPTTPRSRFQGPEGGLVCPSICVAPTFRKLVELSTAQPSKLVVQRIPSYETCECLKFIACFGLKLVMTPLVIDGIQIKLRLR
jgi:hypothetical protein